MELFGGLNSEFLKLVKSSTARKVQVDKWVQYYHDQQSEVMLRLIKQRWTRPEPSECLGQLGEKVINNRANLYFIRDFSVYKSNR